MKLFMHLFILVFSHYTFSAGGYEKPSLWSAKSSSLGGAYSSHYQGAESLYFNPANIFVKDQQLNISGSISNGYLESAFTESYKTKKSQTESVLAVGISYVKRYSENTMIGFGIHSVGGISTHYKDISFSHMGSEMSSLGENPYSELSLIELNLLTIAQKYKNHKFGISLTGHIGSGAFSSYSEGYSKNLGAYAVSDGTPLSLSNVELYDLQGTSFGSFNLGWGFDLNDKISFGASYRSETLMKTKGKAKGFLAYTNTGAALTNALTYGAFNPTAGQKYKFDETDTEVSTYLPQKATVSTTLKNKKSRLSLEVSWTEYSKNKTLQIDNTSLYDPSTGTSTDVSDLNVNWKDLYDYKVGYSYDYSETLQLRAGYTYSTPVSDKETMGPTFATPNSFQHFGLGLGKRVNNVEYNVALEHYESAGTGSTESTELSSTAQTKSITGNSRSNVNALLFGANIDF